MLEEERRLFYVGMTRAQRRLYLTWARSRWRYGSEGDEATRPSRFLAEIPSELVEDLSESEAVPQLDLFAERHDVREAVRRHRYTGTAQNSLENISRFFEERGLPPLKTGPWAPRRGAASAAPSRAASEPAGPGTGSFGQSATGGSAAPAKARSRKLSGMRPGVTVTHPKYGCGLVMRMEGTGEEAKLTISFPGHGLKKILAKFAEIKILE
jgi:DNA helicase-2/ATP-dependent DNA helicase PcrA